MCFWLHHRVGHSCVEPKLVPEFFSHVTWFITAQRSVSASHCCYCRCLTETSFRGHKASVCVDRHDALVTERRSVYLDMHTVYDPIPRWRFGPHVCCQQSLACHTCDVLKPVGSSLAKCAAYTVQQASQCFNGVTVLRTPRGQICHFPVKSMLHCSLVFAVLLWGPLLLV